MVIHIAEKKAATGPVNDEPDVLADPYRPEVLVLCLIEFVEAQTRGSLIHLQIEGRGFDRLLFFAGQAGEAVGKRVGDPKVHGATPGTPS